jgi:hypothetical protein
MKEKIKDGNGEISGSGGRIAMHGVQVVQECLSIGCDHHAQEDCAYQ